jgi:hypothetical protein
MHIFFVSLPFRSHCQEEVSVQLCSFRLLLLLLLLLYWRYNPVSVLASSIGCGGFVTVDISGVGLTAPRPAPNLEDQGLHFVWPLPFDLFGMGSSTRSLRSHQHSTPGHWGAQTSSAR